MKWFGYPIETITAVIDGRVEEVGIVYRWADGKRRTRWLVPRSEFNADTIERTALPDCT